MNKSHIYQMREWVIKNKIDEKTMDYFQEKFKEYQSENKEKYNKYLNEFCESKLSIHIQTVSLKINNWSGCNYSQIEVVVGIHNERASIGHYTALYNFNAEKEEDNLTFHF